MCRDRMTTGALQPGEHARQLQRNAALLCAMNIDASVLKGVYRSAHLGAGEECLQKRVEVAGRPLVGEAGVTLVRRAVHVPVRIAPCPLRLRLGSETGWAVGWEAVAWMVPGMNGWWLAWRCTSASRSSRRFLSTSANAGSVDAASLRVESSRLASFVRRLSLIAWIDAAWAAGMGASMTCGKSPARPARCAFLMKKC